MPHDVDLIILLAVGFGIALIFGYIAARLHLPPLIGYLVAGIEITCTSCRNEADFITHCSDSLDLLTLSTEISNNFLDTQFINNTHTFSG